MANSNSFSPSITVSITSSDANSFSVSSLSLPQIHHLFSTKLKSKNFISWRTQFLTVNGMQGMVNALMVLIQHVPKRFSNPVQTYQPIHFIIQHLNINTMKYTANSNNFPVCKVCNGHFSSLMLAYLIYEVSSF